jgi:hypothetical protein
MSVVSAVLDILFTDAWRDFDIWISDGVRIAVRLAKELSAIVTVRSGARFHLDG